MNYLYRESTISNSVDNVLILGTYLVLHHHCTLTVFDHSLNMIRKRYFYDKIISIKKISDSSIAILFVGNKLVQCDLNFNPIALRIVEGFDMDIYNNICIVYNKNMLNFFNIKEEEIKTLKFATFSIYNITKAYLMINYVPTLLVHSHDNEISKISIINLDGIPSKVDEFETIENPIGFKITDRFIVVLNRNFIQIKYKRESFIAQLNQNLDFSIINANLKTNIIEMRYDNKNESKNIFLENPVIYTKDDTIFILNGNGELFSLNLKLEAKKVLSIDITFKGRISRPSCIDHTDNIVCIGSIHDDTVLYEISDSMDIIEKSRLDNIGLITGITNINSRDLILATSKGVYKATPGLEILIYNKRKVDLKVTKLLISENTPYLITQDAAYSIDEELNITEKMLDERLINEIENSYSIILNKNNILNIFLNDKIIKEIPSVSTWSFNNNFLMLIRNGKFEYIDCKRFKVIFSSEKLLEFNNEIYNEEIIEGLNIKEIPSKTSIDFPEIAPKSGIFEKIVEMKIFNGKATFFLFRTAKQLYIYKYSTQKLIKIFIDRQLSFVNENQVLFDLKKLIYCRSKHPSVILFDNDVHVYETTLKMGYPVILNEWIFTISKGHILKCKLADLENLIFSENFILKRLYSYSNCILEPFKPHKDTDLINLIEDYRETPTIKHILSLPDCNILSVAKQVPFFYEPFIPMVHITDGPDGKPHSEPIDKEEAEYVNKNPALRGRTLEYSIELRSLDYKLISKTVMEDNEFICDMKILFNNFLMVCTSFPEGEDKMAKGKLTIYSLANIVPDPENMHITKKLKYICSETFKNPCLSCEEIRSLISVCVGTRMMIYEFNENTGLVALGRNEISLLCTSIFTTKNLIAISDILNGIYFFFLRPRDPLRLHPLGRSCKITNCVHLGGIDFIPADENEKAQFSIIAGCKDGSLHIFTYSPYDPGSKNGNRLIKRAEIVTKLNNPLYFNTFGQIGRSESIFISSSVLVRVCAIGFGKIQAIQHCISIFISNNCGINVRNYLETEEYTNVECKSVISERILLEFFNLKPTVQEKICELVGLDYFQIAGLIENCLYNTKKHIS